MSTLDEIEVTLRLEGKDPIQCYIGKENFEEKCRAWLTGREPLLIRPWSIAEPNHYFYMGADIGLTTIIHFAKDKK
jgi:hypothetical protein